MNELDAKLHKWIQAMTTSAFSKLLIELTKIDVQEYEETPLRGLTAMCQICCAKWNKATILGEKSQKT